VESATLTAVNLLASSSVPWASRRQHIPILDTLARYTSTLRHYRFYSPSSLISTNFTYGFNQYPQYQRRSSGSSRISPSEHVPYPRTTDECSSDFSSSRSGFAWPSVRIDLRKQPILKISKCLGSVFGTFWGWFGVLCPATHECRLQQCVAAATAAANSTATTAAAEAARTADPAATAATAFPTAAATATSSRTRQTVYWRPVSEGFPL